MGGLSAALRRTNDRIAQIARKARDRRSGVKDYRALIEALQERARRLRERIAAAIELYERYAKALIIDELEDRRTVVALKEGRADARLDDQRRRALRLSYQRAFELLAILLLQEAPRRLRGPLDAVASLLVQALLPT